MNDAVMKSISDVLHREARAHVKEMMNEAFAAIDKIAEYYNVKEIDGFTPASTLLNLMTEKPGTMDAHIAMVVADLTETVASSVLNDVPPHDAPYQSDAQDDDSGQGPRRRAKKKAAKRASDS